eukprot:08672.XXX_168968_169069_1 [CDS] Oithona nana genome sequencing.
MTAVPKAARVKPQFRLISQGYFPEFHLFVIHAT